MNSRSKINRRIPAGHTKQLNYNRLEKRQLLAADIASQPIELASATDTITATYAPSSITVMDSAATVTDDFGNDAGSARSLNVPFDVAGSIDALGDEDWFRFNAVAGWNYEFEIVFDALTTSQLSIYGTDGTPLEQTNAPTVSWVAPQSGTYYLSVEDSFGSEISDYQLSGFVPESTLEFNTPTFGAPGLVGFDLYDATGFAAGATIAIESSSGDIEILPVTAAAGFNFSASIGSVEGLASPNDGTLQVSSGDTLTATYLDSQNGNGGSFTSIDTVTIFADEHGNDFESSTALNFPFNLSERIETPGDEDWFSFDATEGLQYDFEVGFDGLSESVLELYDTDGLTRLPFFNLTWIAPESGTYFLSFDVRDTESTGNYQLLGSSTVPNSSIGFSRTGYYLPEIIELTTTDATGFAQGATVLIESSSGDTETVVIDSGGLDFSLTIDSALGAGSLNDGVLQVASGDTLTATYFDLDDGVGAAFTAVDTARIFVDDHGADAATATPLDLPANISGTIEIAGDRDWFSFSATAGETYQFAIPADDVGTVLAVYSNDGIRQLRQDDSFDPLINWVAPSDGVYYLSVRSSVSNEIGNYELTARAIVDDQHGNDAATATPLELPADIAASIGVAGEQDWFSFDATAGDEYLFQIPLADLDTELALYSIDGTTQLFRDRSNSATRWIAPNDGTYFLSVAGRFSDEIGNYELTAELFPDDYGDDASTATGLDLPASISGSIERIGDQDWFSFSATAGEAYRFEVPVRDAELILYGANGITQLERGPSILWVAPSDGTYYLSVGFRFSFTTIATGNYELTAEVIVDDHGSDPVTATLLGLPANISGAIELEGDQDWFVFAATAGEAYRFEVPVDDEISELKLYSTNGTTELEQDFHNPSIIWEVPRNGLYYLSVEFSSGIGSYQLTAEVIPDDHGDNAFTSTPFNVPGSVSGSLNIPDDEDWFRFNASANTTYEFSVPTLDGFIEFDLYDVSGETELVTGSSFSSLRVLWNAPSDGAYFISVRSASSGFADFELAVKVLVDDHSDSFATATPLDLPANVFSAIETSSDEDWFSFSATAGESYQFEVPFDTETTRLTLYGTDGTTQLEQDAINPSILWVAPSDGTYFLSVRGFFGDIGAYGLTARLVTDDHGDDSAASTLLSLPADVSGSIEIGGDEDWFSFNAVAGEYYQFSTPSLDESVNLFLYDTDGESQLDRGFSHDPSILWVAPSNGLYFLSAEASLSSFIGSYELSVSLVGDDHGDIPATATSVSFPGSASGSIELPGDQDWFSFTAAPATKFEFAIPVHDERVRLTLYGTDGVTQLQQSTDSTPSLIWSVPAAGTYYLSVDSLFSDDIGNYELRGLMLDDDYGDVATAATPFAVASDVTGTIEIAGDEDWFSFEAIAGRAYDFALDWGGPGAGRLSLIGTNGSSVLRQDTVDPSFSWNPITSGTYFLAVAGAASTFVGDYQLYSSSALRETTITFDAETYLLPNIAETLSNQVTVSLLDGNGFVPGATIAIETSSGDSETVVVTSNGVTFTTSLVTVEGLASPNDGMLQVNSGDQVMATYFDPDYGLAGKFFRETVDVFVDDRGDNPETASFVDFPASASGRIEITGDRDWFRFSARAGLEYKFEVNLGSSLTSVLALYDTDGVSLLLSDVSNTRAEISWLAPESGQYYLVVGDLPNTRFNRTGTYQLTGSTSGPVIEDVIFGSTQFTDDFIDVIGDNGLGYSIVGAHQRDALPWANIDTFYLQFSEDVSGSLSAAGVQVVGTHGGTYDVEFVGYDTGSNTAEFRINNDISSDSLVISIFDGAVTNAAGGVLDGEWTSDQVGASGDGVSGGRFDFFFNILAGDEDGSDEVNVDDAIGIFSYDTQTVNLTNFRRDIDGSGLIDSADALAAFANNASGLVASPTAPAPNAGVTVVLLGDVGHNGTTNFLDISPFISLLSTGDFQEEADINRDGLVNFLDISPFINLLSSGGSNSQFAVSQVSTSPLALSLPASEAVAVQSIASSRSSRQISDGISVELVESPSDLSLVPTEAVAFEPDVASEETSQQPSETVGAQLSRLPTEPSQVLTDETSIEVVSTPSSFSLATSTVAVAGLTASSPERSLLAAIDGNAVPGLVDSVKLQSTIPTRAEQSTVLAGSRANDSDDQVVLLLTDDLELVVFENAGEQVDVDRDLFEGLSDAQLDDTFEELALLQDY